LTRFGVDAGAGVGADADALRFLRGMMGGQRKNPNKQLVDEVAAVVVVVG